MTPGQWVGAVIMAIIAGLPIGMCSFFIAGAATNSAPIGFFAWGLTILCGFIMAAGMIKAQGDKAELRKRQLAELREKQG
jgi:hypothetical protein